MSLLTWNSTYSVNIVEIDNQHKKLIDLINQLYDAKQAGAADTIIQKVFNELVSYTFTHFNYEESLLRKANYSDLAEHCDIHKSIVERVRNLQKQYNDGSATAINDTLEFMKNWLMKHIAGTDKKYSQELNAAGIR
ncbi:MAG TPA: bacteriohemerythrin [Bacteroidales bacterium]|nr:bacteriohemerythrin [Bacteroidales bacterium]